MTVVGIRKRDFPIDEPFVVQLSCRRELNFIFVCVSTLPFPPSTVAWSLLVEVWAPQANSGHRSDTPCFKNSIFPKEFNSFLVGQMQHPRVLIENYDFSMVFNVCSKNHVVFQFAEFTWPDTTSSF